METVTIREIQHHLATYLRRVEQGEAIGIRRRNRIIARLVAAIPDEPAKTEVNWGEVREWRERVWGKKPVPGKPASEILYESRGEIFDVPALHRGGPSTVKERRARYRTAKPARPG